MCTRMRHIYYTLFVHMTNVFHVISSMPELSFIPIYKRSFIVFFNVYTSHLCVWSQHASQAIFFKFFITSHTVTNICSMIPRSAMGREIRINSINMRPKRLHKTE